MLIPNPNIISATCAYSEVLLARIISIICHPVLTATYAFVFIFWWHPFLFVALEDMTKWRVLGVVFLNTAVLPVLIILLMHWFGMISSVHMEHRKERFIPYLLMLLLFGTIYYRLEQLPFPHTLNLIILTATITLGIVFFANFLWKVSVHMAGMGALAGIIFMTAPTSSYDIFIPLLLTLFAAGLTGMARLTVGAHTPAQVYTGFVAGWCSASGVFYYFG